MYRWITFTRDDGTQAEICYCGKDGEKYFLEGIDDLTPTEIARIEQDLRDDEICAAELHYDELRGN